MKVLQKIFAYISFKKDVESKNNINLRMMHGINKISLLLFLAAMVVLFIRYMTS
ncbi:MAG: DUF6728 family protein [Bacteroidota bacterium]|nr:DUF6728 family protein [Bacteroidota bacterium]